MQVKQERPLPSPGSQGMLDRSRMALCAFVFLCLSFNPLASLLRGSSAPTPVGSPGTAGPGRSIMAEPGTAGKRWHGVEAVGVGVGWRLSGGERWDWGGWEAVGGVKAVGGGWWGGLEAGGVQGVGVQGVGVGVKAMGMEVTGWAHWGGGQWGRHH